MSDNLFNNYRRRMTVEAWIKSVTCAVIVGFFVLLVSALALWFSVPEFAWISAIIFVATIAGVSPLFFFLFFRPTEKDVARRIDSMGFEERFITMQELSGDNSVMAMKQREDTEAAIKSPKAISSLSRVVPTKSVWATIGTAFGLSACVIVVAALITVGIIPSGDDIIKSLKRGNSFEITYEIKGEGSLEGNVYQIVKEGEDAEEIIAVPDDNWVFVGWQYNDNDYKKKGDYVEDGTYRQDTDVKKSIVITAVFEEMTEDPDDTAMGLYGGSDDDKKGKKPLDEPGPPADEKKPYEGDTDSLGNKILDGETNYQDSYDQSYQEAMDGVSENGDMGDDYGGVVGDYFDNISN